MKQKIYLLGLITTMVIVLASLLKMNHWPGAGQLMILGVFTLVCVFIPLALRNHYLTDGNRRNASLYIVTWLTCFVVFVGMLFKVLHWPYAAIAIIIALPFPYVVFLPVFLAVTSRNKSFSIYNTVSVLFLLSGVSVFSLLLALNVSKEKINDSMLLSGNYNRLEAVLDPPLSLADQASVPGKIDEILAIIDDYQSLIFTTEGFSEEEWNNDPWILTKPETSGAASPALVIEGKDPALDIRLQTALQSLVNEAEGMAGFETLAKAAPAIFDYKESTDRPDDWTFGTFIASPRIWSLVYLDALETNLKLLRAGM